MKNKNEIVIVAHRGKGPTSIFTAAKDEFWKECSESGSLIHRVVPYKLLVEQNSELETLFPHEFTPENTIAAFRQGLLEGADAIELDIFLSKDGIPMVVHDDELNRNVSGALRSAKQDGDLGYLGNVSEYTVEQLQQFDMGNGSKIPTLTEVIDFVSIFNKVRQYQEKKPIILNIEFKDQTEGNVKNTIAVINEASRQQKIMKENVIFCSFKHEALFEAIREDDEAKVALALKTVYLFGQQNVDTNKGWTVKLGIKYTDSAISGLAEKIDERVKYNGKQIVALDSVLWDIEAELIDFVRLKNIALHAST